MLSPLKLECLAPEHSNFSFPFQPSSRGTGKSQRKALGNSGIASPRASLWGTARPSSLPLPPWIRRLNWPSANAGETQHRPRTDSNGFFSISLFPLDRLAFSMMLLVIDISIVNHVALIPTLNSQKER